MGFDPGFECPTCLATLKSSDRTKQSVCGWHIYIYIYIYRYDRYFASAYSIVDLFKSLYELEWIPKGVIFFSQVLSVSAGAIFERMSCEMTMSCIDLYKK